MNNPWGDRCFTCGVQPTGEEYGLLGPLRGVQEQKLICKNCVDFIKKYRKQEIIK